MTETEFRIQLGADEKQALQRHPLQGQKSLLGPLQNQERPAFVSAALLVAHLNSQLSAR